MIVSLLFLKKKYVANTLVKNSKFPVKSTAKDLFWLYDFNFKKIFELTNDTLKITFKIESKKGMPFMFGYHPAFMLNGHLEEIIKSSNHTVSISKIIDGGSVAYSILNTDEVTLIKKKGQNIHFKTAGFENFMLWTEVSNMVCIEPITAYPYTGDEMLGNELFTISKGEDVFSIEIIVVE